ncbi:unnamed protein product [Ectocarpus sp. 6 AP-2014]
MLGRRKAGEAKRDMELTRAAQNKAAIHIQTAQRRKAAIAAAETRRTIQALQRRKSAEIAAISIQRVVRGQAARTATGAEVGKRKGNEDEEGFASSVVAGPEASAENDGVGAPIPASTPLPEQVQTSALLQEDESKAQDATAAQQHEAESSPSATADLQQPPAVAALSPGEKAARAQAACRIQAIGRGRAARTVAQERRQKRIEEQFHRASVWGQRVDGGQDTTANQRASEKLPTPKSSPQAPLRSSSLFSSGTGAASRDVTESLGKQKGQPEAATLIQAAFRGGKARWEADRLRDDYKTRKIEADARAREKLEADAAVRIQTQARARAARARREEHRQRHVARVGSIRSSGKAAADDLRALSRPATASAAVAATNIGQSPTVVGAAVVRELREQNPAAREHRQQARVDDHGHLRRQARKNHRVQDRRPTRLIVRLRRRQVLRGQQGSSQAVTVEVLLAGVIVLPSWITGELRDTIDKELAAKLAEQEKERERTSREAEEERKRDREAVEEAMRAVQEAHNKDSEEIALIKVRLEEEEDARRAEQDAALQVYENCLAEIRAEAEKSRVAAEAVEALRREVAEKEEEKRKLREEADAQTQDQEAKEKRSKEQQSLGGGGTVLRLTHFSAEIRLLRSRGTSWRKKMRG